MAPKGLLLSSISTLLLAHAVLALDPPFHRYAPSLHVLLDTSTSMASQNRVHKARAALQHWISTQVPEGSELGLWQFTRQSKQLGRARISDFESRNAIVNLIPEKPGGQSCILCAVSHTIEELKENSTLIVITDGEDNSLQDDDYVSAETENISDSILVSNIKIVIILMGSTFNDNFGMLSRIHNGYMYHANDDDAIPSLIFGLERLSQFPIKLYPASITIFEKEESPAEKQISIQWTVDPLLSRASQVCVDIYYWPRSMIISGNVSSPNDVLFPLDLQDGHSQYCELHAKAGRWTAKFRAEEFNKFVAILVTARREDSNLLGTFVCWIDKTRKPFSLHASLLIGNGTILRRVTRAEVQSLAGPGLRELELWDNGVGADELAGDEIFSRYINPHTGPGLYAAKCECAMEIIDVNSNHTAFVFSRNSRTSVILIDSESKTYPPSPIRNLKASAADGTILDLRFTATGNELDSGKALLYTLIIRADEYHTPLYVTNLTNTPLSFGSEETITYRFSSLYFENFQKLFVSVFVLGTTGLRSEESNVVEVVLKEAGARNRGINVTTEFSEETSTEIIGISETEQDIRYLLPLVYIFVALTALVFVMCIIVCYLRKKNSGRYHLHPARMGNTNLQIRTTDEIFQENDHL